MPTLDHDGAHLFYLDQGQGPITILAIHAFPMHSRMWAEQVAALQGRARILAPDLRGFGKSSPAPETLSMELAAGDLVAVLDAAGVRDAVVMGLSMGGYVAFELYRRAPERFRALVLADTRAGADGDEARANRLKFADEAMTQGIKWVAEQMLPKLLGPSPAVPVREKVKRLLQENAPAAVAAAQRGMAARPDSKELLPRISCPTLVLVGQADGLTPPAESEAMAAAIPGATLAVLEGGSHLSNIDVAPAFNAQLSAFLDRLTA